MAVGRVFLLLLASGCTPAITVLPCRDAETARWQRQVTDGLQELQERIRVLEGRSTPAITEDTNGTRTTPH
jgi:hypothetical protein